MNQQPKFLTYNQLIELHKLLVEEFGGKGRGPFTLGPCAT